MRSAAGSMVFPSAMARSCKRRSIGQASLEGCQPEETLWFIFLQPPVMYEGVEKELCWLAREG